MYQTLETTTKNRTRVAPKIWVHHARWVPKRKCLPVVLFVPERKAEETTMELSNKIKMNGLMG
jgi:hypothetical protein